MITADDIKAFEQDNAEAINAAAKYARRAAKGLPADRFTDGTKGAMMVARGIVAHQRIMAMQAAIIVDLMQAMIGKGDGND
jgi:hypothetical protein